MRTLIAFVLVSGGALSAADKIDFDRQIRPILSNNCYKCHGPDKNSRQADLRLDDKDAAFAKRDAATIVAGKPEASELIRRITSNDPDEKMPPADSKKKLTPEQIKLLTQWIREGAEWKSHWAFIKPERTAAPDVKHQDFVLNDVDKFILAKLKASGLTPSKQADRVTLIRRLSFDLLGLPPSIEEVQSFVDDKDPKAVEKLIDRLLKSPHFGERMAIYWLDVVRFADSNGYHSDEPRQIAPYRDYVISSFNSNKPYDQFVVEQLAGDLFPEASMEAKVASGFNMLLQTTSEGGAQAKEYLAKYSADRVRNTSSIFLGVTMGCAECHDHKFDPFTTRDFYRFAAFFADVKERGVGNPTPYPVMTDDRQAKIAEYDKELAQLRADLNKVTPELTAELQAWEKTVAEKVKSVAKLSPWHALGPFKAANFDAAFATDFGAEKEIDLKKQYKNQKWREAKQYVDGKPHAFNGDNTALYLFRNLQVDAATKLSLSLGSDDGIIVWVNGKKVLNKKVLRGVAPDQEKITVDLKAGDNQLLMKIANASGGAGFYFAASGVNLPNNVINALKVAPAKRNQQQKNVILAHFRGLSKTLAPTRDKIAKVDAARKQYVATVPKTLMTVAVKPRPIRVLPRGNWMDDSGELVEPGIPQFLGQLEVDGRANRMHLARWVVNADNPLTSRAFVNRLWKLFFGQGLAAPLDDLGAQGTQPTHPELMDYLATQFIDSGWDVKKMVRLLVTSGTYRQASLTTPSLREKDPYNSLYGRQSRFRLDAEIVRDNALALSGLLSNKIGGPSVKPYQPAGYWRHMNFPVRRWQASQGEDLYRRGLYTWWQRMFLHPSMLAFDAPSREECTVERPRSNTPQQALVLLNDPTYVEAARTLAARIHSEGGDSAATKLTWAYQHVLSRKPVAIELEVMTAVYKKHKSEYGKNSESAQQLLAVGAGKPTEGNSAELAAWTSVARVLLNLHETITRN